jgi:hypothetical protein
MVNKATSSNRHTNRCDQYHLQWSHIHKAVLSNRLVSSNKVTPSNRLRLRCHGIQNNVLLNRPACSNKDTRSRKQRLLEERGTHKLFLRSKTITSNKGTHSHAPDRLLPKDIHRAVSHSKPTSKSKDTHKLVHSKPVTSNQDRVGRNLGLQQPAAIPKIALHSKENPITKGQPRRYNLQAINKTQSHKQLLQP